MLSLQLSYLGANPRIEDKPAFLEMTQKVLAILDMAPEMIGVPYGNDELLAHQTLICFFYKYPPSPLT